MASSTESQTAPSLRDIFHEKYTEYATELKGAVPEVAAAIDAALTLTAEQRLAQFKEQVLPGCSPTRDPTICPPVLLPGVKLAPAIWSELSDATRMAIQQHLTLLSFCALFDGTKEGLEGLGSGLGGLGEMGAGFEEFMKNLKGSLGGVDMEGFSNKFSDFLKSSSFSKIPEKFMKGQLAKLCEELVHEFKPEDFGLSEEKLKEYDNEPQKVFELITDIFVKNPEALQKAVKRIASRFQEKFQKGQLRPEQIVAEAEEMMKEFSSNPAFVELLESFRGMFDLAGNMDTAKAAGREGSARSQLVRDRLRKKLDAKKGKAKQG